jgi:hypothetical protein
MKLVLDKKHENRIEFLVSDFSTSFANVVRRYAMSRVPVLAIDAVTYYDNTSAFWDEYLAHRLGLMPIITPDKTPESAEVIFSCDAEGPKVVYASDIQSSDKGITIAKDKIHVATLGPNQHIRFEGKAILGTARTHAKFQAGLVGYSEDEKNIRMFVESFFQMPPADVIIRACDQIEGDLEAIGEALGAKPAKKKAETKKTAKKTTKKASKKKEENAEE